MSASLQSIALIQGGGAMNLMPITSIPQAMPCLFFIPDNPSLSGSINTQISADSVQSIAPEIHREKIAEYLQASLSDNSKRAYLSDVAHFMTWGGSIPATPETVAGYLVAHAKTHSNSTLTRRLVSISRAHTTQGYASPVKTDLVKSTLHGIRRVHGIAQHQVSPTMKSDITAMVDNLPGLIGLRDRALLLVGFAGALRRSELVAINCTDISFVEQGMTIHIRRSKTDQTGEGRKLGIPYARGRHCPILAIKQWMSTANINSGFLFRPVTKGGKVVDVGLSAEAVANIVKKRAQAIGLDPAKYAGHSLRAGLVSSAIQAGIPAHRIQQQTNHKSLDMLSRYIREVNLFVENAGGIL